MRDSLRANVTLVKMREPYTSSMHYRHTRGAAVFGYISKWLRGLAIRGWATVQLKYRAWWTGRWLGQGPTQDSRAANKSNDTKM